MSIEKAYIFAQSLKKVLWVGVASPKQSKRFRMLVRKQEQSTKRPRESKFILLDFFIHSVLASIISKNRGGGKMERQCSEFFAFIKKILLFFVMVFIAAMPAAYAVTQTSFVLDAASPAFDFTENELCDGSFSKVVEASSNSTLYIDIPAHATINTASIQLTGSFQDLGNTIFALDNQSANTALFDNIESSGVSCPEERTTFTGTFTLPENAVLFSHAIIAKASYIYGGRAELWLYNHSNFAWVQISQVDLIGTTPAYLKCTNISIYPDFLGNNNTITIQYVAVNLNTKPYPTIIGSGHQKSSYKIEKTPYNPSLNIGTTLVWSFKGQFKDTDSIILNSESFQNAIQTYVNSCDPGTFCSVPLSFTAQTKGDITLDNININYTYSPYGVSTSPVLNSTTVTANQESYVANLTSFNASTVQDITISVYAVPTGASKCWEETTERTIKNYTCDIADFTWQAGETTPSLKVWSDVHDNVIPASQTNGSYFQDTTNTTIAGGWAYIKQLVTLSNIFDIFKDALDINWHVEPKNDYVCTSCSGAEGRIEEESVREIYSTMKGNNIITKNETAAWIDQVGGHTLDQQNIQKIITGKNTDAIPYVNVYWELSSLPEGYIGDVTCGYFNLSSLKPYTTTATAHASKLNNSWSEWEQSGTVTLDSQVIESNLSVENKDAVKFSGVSWNKDGTNEFITCEKCSGSFTIEPYESLLILANYSGDALVEKKWTDWEQQEAKLDDTVKVKAFRDIENIDIISFSNVDTELPSKTGWSCSGDSTITIPASQEVIAESICTNSEGLVSLEAVDWRQDASQGMTIDSTAFIEGRARGQNNLNEDLVNVKYDESNAEAQCKAEWACTIRESYTDLSILAKSVGAADGYNVKAEKDDIVVSVDGGNTDWKQNTSETTIAGATAYVKGNLKANNVENMDFNNVVFLENTDSQYRGGWSCTHTEKTFNISAAGSWTSNDYPITCAKENVVTKTEGTPTQNISKDSSLSVQYAKKLYTIKNTDNIKYSLVFWEGVNDWGECDKCSGIVDLNLGESTIENVEWHGDVLTESWNEWAQDFDRNNNLSNQHIVRLLSVINKDNILFKDVVWENQTIPALFACNQCNGTLDIEALGNTSKLLLANGDTLNNTLSKDWVGGTAKAGGFTITSKDLRVENLNGKIDFKEIVLNLKGREEWSCTSVESVNLSAGEIVIIQDAIKCFKENVIEKNESSPILINKTVVNVGENLDIIKTIILKNSDVAVKYNASMETRVSEAFEDTVRVRTIEGQLVQPDAVDYEAGVVDWSVLIMNGSPEYTVEYKVAGPYYSHLDEKAVQTSVTSFKYFANITIPNNYSQGVNITASLSTGKFLEWDKHNSVEVLSDNNTIDYKIIESNLTAIIFDTGIGVKELQLSYTIPSIKLNTNSTDENKTSIKVEVNGEEDNGSTTFEGVKNVCIKSENKTITCFEYNFSKNILDLKSFEEETTKTSLGGRVLRGLPLQKNQTKIVLVPKLTNSNQICIVDKEVQNINEVVCNGTNSTYEIMCNNKEQYNYTCIPNGTYYKVTGLRHSGIRELPELKSHKSDGAPNPSNNRGGSGGSPSHRIVKTPVEPGNKESVKLQNKETRLVNPPVVETHEKETARIQTALPQSKATGYLNLISLKTVQGKIISAALFGLLIAVFIGTSVGSLKFPKIQVSPLKTSQLKSESKIQNITKETKPKLNNHMQTILKALHPREEEIMKTLMHYNGHATQARIYHATGIPTTSLSRWVDSLERRELVESTRRGKLRDLRVTKKFRGK